MRTTSFSTEFSKPMPSEWIHPHRVHVHPHDGITKYHKRVIVGGLHSLKCSWESGHALQIIANEQNNLLLDNFRFPLWLIIEPLRAKHVHTTLNVNRLKSVSFLLRLIVRCRRRRTLPLSKSLLFVVGGRTGNPNMYSTHILTVNLLGFGTGHSSTISFKELSVCVCYVN